MEKALRLPLLWLLVVSMLLSLAACGTSTATAWQEQYDLGVRYLNEGNYEEAVLAFQSSIEIDPLRYEGWQGLADAYVGQGNYDMALNVLQQGIDATESPDLQQKLDDILSQETQNKGPASSAPWKSTAPAMPGSGLEAWENSRTGVYTEVWAIASASLYISDGRLHQTLDYTYDEWGRLVKSDSVSCYYDESGQFEKSEADLLTEVWRTDEATGKWVDVAQRKYEDGSVEEEIWVDDAAVQVAGENIFHLSYPVLGAFFRDIPLKYADQTEPKVYDGKYAYDGVFYFSTHPEENDFYESTLQEHLPGANVKYTLDENGNVSRVDLYDGEGSLHSYAELTYSRISVLE